MILTLQNILQWQLKPVCVCVCVCVCVRVCVSVFLFTSVWYGTLLAMKYGCWSGLKQGSGNVSDHSIPTHVFDTHTNHKPAANRT